MSCDGLIDQGSEPMCPQPVGGTEPFLYAANLDDITGYTYLSSSEENVITAIVLKDGAFLYKFKGFRTDVQKGEEVVNPGIGANQLKHTARFVIYNRTQVEKNNIENLMRGNFVFVVPNNGKNTESLEVVGAEVGVQMVPGVIRQSHENGGYFILNFATPDTTFETKLHHTYLVTSYALSIAALEAQLPTS